MTETIETQEIMFILIELENALERCGKDGQDVQLYANYTHWDVYQPASQEISDQ